METNSSYTNALKSFLTLSNILFSADFFNGPATCACTQHKIIDVAIACSHESSKNIIEGISG